MSTLGSRLVCLVVAGMGGLFVSAADYNQTVDLGTRCSGDAVNATATPPGTVLSGGVNNPGGFTWSGGPASFDGTIPRTFSGSHAGKFSGTYRPDGHGSGGESTINTWEMGTAAMVVKVDLIPIPSGNTPELVNGRICINAQPSYKKAKWKAVVKPSGTTATVTPISGGVAISGGSGISDGATFWVTGGAKTGDYKIKITHDSCASCTASGGDKVFKFVTKARNTGITGPDNSPRNWLWARSPSVIQVQGFCNMLGLLANTASATTYAERESKITTDPTEGLYTGSVGATAQLVGNQAGFIMAQGFVGFNVNGTAVALASATISWKGKIELSGGGLTSPCELSDGGFTATAPDALLILMVPKSISYSFDYSWPSGIYQTDTWINYKGTIEISASSSGLPLLSSAATTLEPMASDALTLNGGSGIPTMSGFTIQ